MDYHLEHGLRLHHEPKHKSLYSWAINEIDAQGQPIGDDQIPWAWTLNFTATSCVLGDSIEIGSRFHLDEATPATPQVAQQEVIRIQLRAGGPRDDGKYFRQTTFSMFGTARTINSFQLDIRQLADPAEHEVCTVWGIVSYTTEIDFRHETFEDCIVFHLLVQPETFARYAAKISQGSVDELIFSVGSVSGFYSEWSPSIFTRRIKVLTGDSGHKVDLPTGLQFSPPRLGSVGNAELHVNRRLEFREQSPDFDVLEGTSEAEAAQVIPGTELSAIADPRTLHLLISLKRAAWSGVAFLALIFIATLL